MSVSAAQSLLALLGDAMPDTARAARLAIVDPDYVGGPARVTFDGEDTLSGKGYPWLAPYSPSPGDRVVMLPIGKLSYVIVGGSTVKLEAEKGTIPISRGGTGASTEAGARTNLGVNSKDEDAAALSALGVELIDEVNALVAAHAAAEVTARAMAISTAIEALRAQLRPIILQSPNGNSWRLGVANDGSTIWTAVTP